MSSDMVHPRRAASCFKRDMTESSMFKVVFIHITIQQIWLYVKICDFAPAERDELLDENISYGFKICPYSYLMHRAGLIRAVFRVWRLIVRRATPKVRVKARTKAEPPREIR